MAMLVWGFLFQKSGDVEFFGIIRAEKRDVTINEKESTETSSMDRVAGMSQIEIEATAEASPEPTATIPEKEAQEIQLAQWVSQWKEARSKSVLGTSSSIPHLGLHVRTRDHNGGSIGAIFG
jgi:hypothetical protein